VASVGDREGAYRVLMGRPDGKRPVGRPRNKLKDNVKIVGMGDRDWFGLVQDRASTCECSCEPLDSIQCR